MDIFKKLAKALAGVVQLVGCHPANRKVVGLIPSQGTCLGCRFSPSWVVYKRQLIDVSLPLSSSLPLSLESIK